MQTRTRLTPLLLLLLAVPLGPARAVTIVGEAGAPGEDGESVAFSDSLIVGGSDAAALQVQLVGGAGGYAPEDGSAPAGDGGGAALGPLFAASQTGPVSVVGSAVGGDGGRGREGAPAGDGAPVKLVDAVDGETAGDLFLSQFAQGGDFGLGSGGRAGAATSELHHRASAQALTLYSRAVGGGSQPALRDRGAGSGAPARAVGKAVNRDGSVSVFVSANGGGGGSNPPEPGGRGGAARVVAYGRSLGDDQPVVVGFAPSIPVDGRLAGTLGAGSGGSPGSTLPSGGGYLPPPTLPGADPLTGLPRQILAQPIDPVLPVPRDPPARVLLGLVGAVGGNGGGMLTTFPPSATQRAGDGGPARSLSVGIARGNSPVQVRDVATGGIGGMQLGELEGGPPAGGEARSTALGVGGGDSPVEVEASAAGGGAGVVYLGLGQGVPDIGEGVPGAAAEASAVAVGHGAVRAMAFAHGGPGTIGNLSTAPDAGPQAGRRPGAPGDALARAVGASGEARAGARGNSETLSVQVGAAVGVLRSATVQARVGPARRGARDARGIPGPRGRAARDAFARAGVAPGESQVAAALRRAPALRRALEEVGADRVAALGGFSAAQRQWSRGDSVVSSFELVLDALFPGFVWSEEEVFVGLFAPQLRRGGVQGLRVRLLKEDAVLVDEHFDDAREALAFLDGALFELGILGAVDENPLLLSTLPPLPPPVIRRPERARLLIDLETRLPAAGLELGFLVATAPVAEEPAP